MIFSRCRLLSLLFLILKVAESDYFLVSNSILRSSSYSEQSPYSIQRAAQAGAYRGSSLELSATNRPQGYKIAEEMLKIHIRPSIDSILYD